MKLVQCRYKVLWHSQSSAVNAFRSSLAYHILHSVNGTIFCGSRSATLWSRYIVDKPVDWERHVRVVGSVYSSDNGGASGVEDAEALRALRNFCLRVQEWLVVSQFLLVLVVTNQKLKNSALW